jgi:tRNA uridine 5-carbamoylmethylation protein Kti12
MLAKDGTLKRTEEDSTSTSSDESSELCEKCDEIIVIGDEINYYHFMVVHLWWEGKE